MRNCFSPRTHRSQPQPYHVATLERIFIVKKLIARLRARFVLWLLPDIEGHLIIRSMNFNSRPVDPNRKYLEPVAYIYPRIRPESCNSPMVNGKNLDTKPGLPAPRVPHQHLQ